VTPVSEEMFLPCPAMAPGLTVVKHHASSPELGAVLFQYLILIALYSCIYNHTTDKTYITVTQIKHLLAFLLANPQVFYISRRTGGCM